MKTIVSNYLSGINHKFSRETSTEYSYRTEFESFLNKVFESMNISAIDHDAKSTDGNKPDFAIIKNQVPILYIETKDIGVSLDKIEKSEQMSRYFGYANLILTDYLEFRFYRNGIAYGEPIKIADFNKKTRTINEHEEKFEQLFRRLIDFTKSHKEPIKSGSHLAKIMGGKAQRIRDNIREYLKDDSSVTNDTLKVYKTIKRLLVHDLDLESFSDMYAQTIVYGLFVARFHDDSPDSFTRQEARELIPNSNPFLRHFFDHIVGPDFDKRLEYIVDELCEVFSHSNIEKLMNDFYKKSSKSKTTHDPVIHFYEDFLKEYDSELRKKMGAYYTPTPVVRFMTRSVDYLLKKEFGLKKGLADTTKIKDGKTHRVQVLDPAVGTGTFISAVIREIYKNFTNQQGRWPKYVHNDLLPRIHGFELMMAPYTIAHLKLGMAFKETGFKYFNRRLGIYLTNSLEKDDEQENLFTSFGLADSIAQESKEAQKIKNETPIMVVIGNPPYSVSSSNKGKWITHLIKSYKENLDEKNIQPLSDDYIKFIRFAEKFIETNENGIVAMITNNSFIDGDIHRQMRKHLLKTFDDIYILDLHGNSKKREISPDGSKDENVFNIMQGVSINIFIKKTNSNNKLANIYHYDLYGKRKEKYNSLDNNNIDTIKWKKLKNEEPYYFFVPKDFESKIEYEKGFKIEDLFKFNTLGIATGKDNLIVRKNIKEIIKLKKDFINLDKKELAQKYKASERQIEEVKNDINNVNKDYSLISYRPFDIRYTLYTQNSNGVLQRPRNSIMNNMHNENIALQITSKNRQLSLGYFFISKYISDRHLLDSAGDSMSIFPLYFYEENQTKKLNLNQDILGKIYEKVGKFSPERLIDYIYAILYSNIYRKKYKEFLKIDFPRIPYPKNKSRFKKLVNYGSKLKNLHLMDDNELDNLITTFPKIGSDTVEQTPKYKDKKVFINETQYFGNIPESAWNFYIGGYQPAQKWLKDRKDKSLSSDEIDHYQRMIVSLVETQKLMDKIDEVIEL